MSGTDRLLAGLTDEQLEAVTNDQVPLLVLAGAGSGKTRVLTRRLAWQATQDRIDLRRAMAVTFTRKAATELRRRLHDLVVGHQVTAGTFHALALAQLRRRWLDQGRRPPAVLDRKTRIVGRILSGTGRDTVVAAAREIEWAQARMVGPDEYESVARQLRRTPPVPPTEMAEVYSAYVAQKRKRGVVDFDDLLTLCAAELESDSEWAAAIRWRFRHFFVDEFQDMNPAQFRLLRAWLGEGHDLFAVGDDDQAIYGFGGADARYLTEFQAHFGDGAVLPLRANFRSTPQILSVANALIAPSPGDERRLVATGAEGSMPTLTAYESDLDEATAIAQTITQLQRNGTAWVDIAVLARTNAQCAFLEEALQSARVPARRHDAVRFQQRAEIEAVMAALHEAARADPSGSFRAQLATALERGPRLGPESEAALAALKQLGDEFAEQEGELATAAGFADFLQASVRDEDPMPHAGVVQVLTFHRAKGLEWPVVFVTGLEDGLVPIAHAATEAARQEERRLLHVALTRAQRQLFLTWARRRRFGSGRSVAREPSPLLAGLADLLPDAHVDEDAHEATDVGRRALAEAAASLRAAPADGEAGAGEAGNGRSEELLAALQAWRERKAHAAGVPGAAIVDDLTLVAISDTRPLDEESLAGVPGLGASRRARYGPEIIGLVADYARQ